MALNEIAFRRRENGLPAYPELSADNEKADELFHGVIRVPFLQVVARIPHLGVQMSSLGEKMDVCFLEGQFGSTNLELGISLESLCYLNF